MSAARSTFQPCEQDQLLDRRAHAAAFREHRFVDVPDAGRVANDALLEDLEIAHDDRQRRSQLVSRVGDELTHLQLVALAFDGGGRQPPCDVVIRGRQVTQAGFAGR